MSELMTVVVTKMPDVKCENCGTRRHTVNVYAGPGDQEIRVLCYVCAIPMQAEALLRAGATGEGERHE